MTTNNEAFEVWFSNKLAECRANNDMDMHRNLRRYVGFYKFGFEAATTEANKRMAELQASNNRLRDGIAEIAAEAQDTYTNAALTKLISATPAESLQAHDDKVLERAAKICQRKSDDYKSLAISCDEIKDHVGHDICIHKQAVASSIANAIRSLKEVE
jgi:hypothetical protein